jgi:hypothetical protein
MKGREVMNRPILARRELTLITTQATITHCPDVIRSLGTMTLSQKMSGLEISKGLINMYRILEVQALLECLRVLQSKFFQSSQRPYVQGLIQ